MSEPLQTALSESMRRQTELAGEATKHRRRYQAAKQTSDQQVKELETLRKQVETLTAERDGLTTQLTKAPNALREENEKLKGEIRLGRHKSTFETVAKELKVRPEAINDLFSLSGYKAETDEPDPESIKGIINPLLESRPHMLAQETTSTTQQQQKLPPGPGATRGASVGTQQNGVLKVSRADLSDPTYMRAHQQEIAAASKEGRFVVAD